MFVTDSRSSYHCVTVSQPVEAVILLHPAPWLHASCSLKSPPASRLSRICTPPSKSASLCLWILVGTVGLLLSSRPTHRAGSERHPGGQAILERIQGGRFFPVP